MTARDRPARPRRQPQPGARQADPRVRDPRARGAEPVTQRDNARSVTAGRRPDYVVDVWVSDQIRARLARTGRSLWEALEANRQQAAAQAKSDPEPEAEP